MPVKCVLGPRSRVVGRLATRALCFQLSYVRLSVRGHLPENPRGFRIRDHVRQSPALLDTASHVVERIILHDSCNPPAVVAFPFGGSRWITPSTVVLGQRIESAETLATG